MTIPNNLVQEIRINPEYTQYLYSEFPASGKSGLKDEAKPIIVKRTLFTKDYMKKLSGSAERGILPPNCRYIEPTTTGHVVVIEEPPAIRTVEIQKHFEREVSDLRAKGQKLEDFGFKGFNPTSDYPHKFTLAFPYVIFLLVVENETRITDGLVFLRTQEMRGMSDYLLKAPLSNISENQRVCFGDPNKFKSYSLTQSIQNAIMVFWSASFNTDYTYNYNAYQKRESVFGNYMRWEFMTKQNPLFIYDADWITMDGNLGNWIERVKRDDHLVGQKGISYTKATSVIFEPAKTGTEAQLTKKSKKTMPLYYDIANGMYVGSYFLNIGDPFRNSRGELLFIDSFIGFADGGRLKYIMVDKSGKKFMMKLTRKVQNYIAVSNKAMRYTDKIVLPQNKLEVKTGDILIFKNRSGSEHYGTVDFIRAGRDGRAEIKVGKDYYIAENITATKFKVDKPKVQGINLVKTKRYIFIRDSRGSCPMAAASVVKYDQMRVRSADNIEFQFVNDSLNHKGARHHLPLKASPSGTGVSRIPRLYHEKDVKSFNHLFRVGKNIYFMSTGSSSSNVVANEPLAWELPGGISFSYDNNAALRRPRLGMIETLIENDTTFRLPGYLLDLEFSVGDKVVAADWKNPHEILRVKEIAGFSIVNRKSSSSRCEDLYFILSDKDGKLSKVRYIYGYSGVCHVGRVRKITNIFNRVTSGTKIISKKAGYQGFPKKDVNIIIGFLTDTGGEEPLVLCSNGQTLWFSDMMNDFTRVTMRSKKWVTLQHAPIDLSKIKPQPGDIINATKDYKSGQGYFMTHLPNYRGVRAQVMEYYTGYPESYAMDSRFNREYYYDCIPNPRIRQSQADEFGRVSAWPNFHGLFYYSPKSDYEFINQPGRIINVPSSNK